MSTLAIKLPGWRHRRLTMILAAAVLLVAATLGSAASPHSASAQSWGWPWNYGYGYGYGGVGGYGGYGGLGGAYLAGYALNNNTLYLNPGVSYSAFGTPYLNSQYGNGWPYYGYSGLGYGGLGYSSLGYGGLGYTGYSSYPYSSYSPLYSGSSYLGNGLYSYQPSYSAYAPTTTVTLNTQPYGATYVSGGGNYCNLPNGGMAWVPAGASPSAYGC
jgi:hypothetical protein